MDSFDLRSSSIKYTLFMQNTKVFWDLSSNTWHFHKLESGYSYLGFLNTKSLWSSGMLSLQFAIEDTFIQVNISFRFF